MNADNGRGNKLIVFDLDGTLVNTLPDISQTINRILSENGFSTHPEHEYRTMVGWGLRTAMFKAVQRSCGGKTIDKERFSNLYQKMLAAYSQNPTAHSFVYPGMDVLVNTLENKGFVLGILTNKNEDLAQIIVQRFFDSSVFDFIIGAKPGQPDKPDPSSLHTYLNSRGVSFDSILMVGDSAIDVQLARNAGLDFAGVKWGFGQWQQLLSAGCPHSFDSSAELQHWILNNWSV